MTENPDLQTPALQPVHKLLLSLVCLLVFAAAVYGTHEFLTKPYPGHNDFLPRWEGARSVWLDGISPYSAETSLNIQIWMYEGPVPEGLDPAHFVYPFYVVFLLWPLTGLSYAWASAIWMVLLEACLILAIILITSHFQWRPKPIVLATLFIWTLLAYYPARGLILGQFAMLVYFFQVATIWALGRKYDKLAGVLLALGTLKPQMAYLFVIFMGLWGLREKRWQFVASSIITMLVLLGASFIVEPGWLTAWINQIQGYAQYTAMGGVAFMSATYLFPGSESSIAGISSSTLIEWLLNSVFYLYMFWAWFQVLVKGKTERLMWTIVLTLTITQFVVNRTGTPHYTIFIIPLIFYLRHIDESIGGIKATAAILLILLVLLVQPWLHFITTVDVEVEHWTVYMPAPIFAFLLIVWTRKLWWSDRRERLARNQSE